MYSSCTASQWNKSRGKVCCQILRVFSFCFCTHELSQGTDTQFLIQLLDSRLFVNGKKKIFPRTFFPSALFFRVKKWRAGGMIERYSGFNKDSFAKKRRVEERKPLWSNSFWNIPTGRKQLLWFSLIMLYTQKMFQWKKEET